MHRRGSVYVAVVGVAMIVAVVALAASYTSRLDVMIARGVSDRQRAQLAARSAVELAIAQVVAQPSWRTVYVSGQDEPASGWETLSNTGEYRWQLVDERDGDLADDDSETVAIRGFGRAGQAIAVETVLLEPRGTGLDCLDVSWYTAGNFTVPFLCRITTDQIIGAWGNINASAFGASIVGNVEATGSISGAISGTQTSPVPPRRLPGPSVFDYYLAVGSWIRASELPEIGGMRCIEKCVLSPASNPYGLTNPAGVYVIDCQGEDVAIKNCRVEGTVVAVNLGTSHVELNGALCWNPAAPNLPAILVEGDLYLRHSALKLSESSCSVNFNPPGSPYSAVEDTDQADVYASMVTGLVYASDELRLAINLEEPKVKGCMVSLSCTIQSLLNVVYDVVHRDNPPPGFAAGDALRVIPGSWRREAAIP